MRALKRPTLALALVVLAAAGVITADRVSAAANVTVVGSDFVWTPDRVDIAVGDSVTWTNRQGFHNVIVDGERLNAPGFPNEEPWRTPPSKTFDTAGTYSFFCEVHPAMAGTVVVGGGDPEPTPTPTPEPVPDPGGGAGSDTTAPALSGVTAAGDGGVARITFTLSETATVTARLTASGGAVTTVRVQAAAGNRTIERALPSGTYALALSAVDAWGNRSATYQGEVRVRG